MKLVFRRKNSNVELDQFELKVDEIAVDMSYEGAFCFILF